MVPRMISSLVSYEAERCSIGRLLTNRNEIGRHKYDDERRYPYPLLTFKNTDDKFSGMNNLVLCYPSVFLADIYHPAENLVVKKTLGQLRKELQQKIKGRLEELNIFNIGDKNGDVQKWDWYAVFFLDKNSERSIDISSWAKRGFDNSDNIYDGEDEKRENGATGKRNHFEEMCRCVTDMTYHANVGRINAAQLERLSAHLAELCLGSPAVSCLRSFYTSFPKDEFQNKLRASFNAAMGFITMFNKPESIAIVNSFMKESSYAKNVVKYCTGGNIQSMLDEFTYQLYDSTGIQNSLDCAMFIRDILTVNSGKVEVITPTTMGKNAVGKSGFSMRTHYAIPFGVGSISDLKNGARQIKVREAFNSPFRPFVLTSTSIGQEGLDFHYYCSKLIHWNLPSNPIDLEQREGRIKRFKGLGIRKKIAAIYLKELFQVDRSDNIWSKLFEHAEKGKPQGACDLIPFWHLDLVKEYDIKTLIPIYEFSKDFDKLWYIKNVLGNYRLTFGQPRQEELVYILGKISKTVDGRKKLKELAIDLCPFNQL